MKNAMLFLIVASVLVGCKGETGPAGPLLKGNVSGYMVLFDTLGRRMSDKSGVQVSIDGTSYSTTTGSDGKWTLKDVSTGTYVMSFAKANFSPYKLFGFSFVGGGDAFLYDQYLFALPTFQVSTISTARSISDRTITVSGTVISANSETVVLFFDRSSTVSPTSSIFYLFAYSTRSGTTNSFSSHLSAGDFDYYGISASDKLYVRAYPHARGGSAVYRDPSTGKNVLTTVGTVSSNLDSVVVP